jgi:hypothetical protein
MKKIKAAEISPDFKRFTYQADHREWEIEIYKEEAKKNSFGINFTRRQLGEEYHSHDSSFVRGLTQEEMVYILKELIKFVEK